MRDLVVANRVLRSFSPARIERRPGGCYVYWSDSRGEARRRWQTRHGQDFYPVWSHSYPGGGTSMIALSQLIRWLRGQPVLPLSTWRNWAGPQVQLLTAEAVEALREGGYPEIARCVLCGIDLRNFDWWNLDGVSGPCCRWTEGCRQEIQATVAARRRDRQMAGSKQQPAGAPTDAC